MGSRLAPARRTMPVWLKCVLVAVILLAYVGIAAVVVFLVSRSGAYPSGADTMFYVYRGDFLYRSITQEGNWYPLIDMQWYNGVQTWRYWSPLSAYILAACQAVAGGSSFSGYLLCVGVLYFLSALVWLVIGVTHHRPWMGAFLGLIWFLVPNNAFMFFIEGVLARSMSMCVLPWFVVSVYDYLHRPIERRWPCLVSILASYVLIIMCHLGWAGMLAIALLLFFLFDKLLHFKKDPTAPILPVLLCLVLGFAITGLWAYPSLVGGITGIDSSSIMKGYFQSLSASINPFYGHGGGEWNRWIVDPSIAYYGCAAFALSLFGLFLSNRTVAPGFATALSICLLSTTAAYPILALLPGAQYLWMLRFISIALTFLLASLLLWRSLKRHWQAIVAVLLACEVGLSYVLVVGEGTGLTPEARYDALAQSYLIDVAQRAATQRFSIAEPFNSPLDAIYVSAGYGQGAVATSYGQGVQAAPQYTNIVRINEAAENGQFRYMFDRLLALGNDVVSVPVSYLDVRYHDAQVLDAAAAAVGYSLIAHNDAFRVYKLRAAPEAGHFGVVSHYRCAAIGTDAGTIAMGFPAVEELDETVLDAYTYDQLKDYDTLYLAGFTYRDKDAAEELVLRLSENGTRVLILADGVPDEEHTGSKTFLGVSCNRVNFQNGYPALDTIDGVLYCDLFPSGYAQDWQTVYVNGLDQVWGTITDVPEGQMDFYGTVKNDNIVFIGLALTYHYSLTLDAAVGQLLSHALQVDPSELPQREIVPIDVDYRDNVITIDAPCDNVNTTLSYHDIFRSDRDIREVNHLTVVDQGRTVIQLVYPYFVPGLLITLAGLVLGVGYILWYRKRCRHAAARHVAAEPPAEATPQQQEDKEAPVQ